MATEGLSLKEKAASFANADDITDPHTAYALSLLQKISNIAWDYKNCSRSVGDNLPSQLCGTIGNEAKSGIQENPCRHPLYDLLRPSREALGRY